MKIVRFLDKTWQEIPDRVNPALRYEGQIDNCIMIFKGEYSRIADGGFVVARVMLETSLTLLGVFWTAEMADVFAGVASEVAFCSAHDIPVEFCDDDRL